MTNIKISPDGESVRLTLSHKEFLLIHLALRVSDQDPKYQYPLSDQFKVRLLLGELGAISHKMDFNQRCFGDC